MERKILALYHELTCTNLATREREMSSEDLGIGMQHATENSSL